jgi:hypothetical protein
VCLAYDFVPGPIIHYRSYGRSTVILNTGEAAIDVLVRRGASYADRPYRRLFKVAGAEEQMPTASEYSPRIQKQRRMVSNVFGKGGEERTEHIISQECQRFVRRISEDPQNLIRHMQMSASVLYRISYCT